MTFILPIILTSTHNLHKETQQHPLNYSSAQLCVRPFVRLIARSSTSPRVCTPAYSPDRPLTRSHARPPVRAPPSPHTRTSVRPPNVAPVRALVDRANGRGCARAREPSGRACCRAGGRACRWGDNAVEGAGERTMNG